MEADIEFTTVIFALMFVMAFIVPGLSVIASMIDMFKFAHGAFVLLGSYTRYPFHERGLPVWCVTFAAPLVRALVRSLLEETSTRRCHANPIIACSARSPR